MKYFTPLILLIAVLASCQKELPPNPYDKNEDDGSDSTQTGKVDSTSFVALHAFIFKPTCANAGCHDGTFEPDFRTVESAYNTLVYHPVVKNDPVGTYTYRVQPFEPDKSVLITRLTEDIDGQSGIMPLSIDPDSDFPQNRERYISYIRQWIADGAPDMLGRLPSLGNREPQMQGVVAYDDNNNQLLDRKPGHGSLKVPANSASITLWFAVSDDSTDPGQLAHNKIKLSTVRDDFSGSTEEALTVVSTPMQEEDYFGENAEYYHKFTVQNPSQYGGVGTVVFFRIYVKDPQHDVTEIPGISVTSCWGSFT
jgi:hypothetical protein